MAAGAYEYAIEEIKARLAAHPIELAHALGLQGKISGNSYWVRDPRRSDGGNLSSFSINMGKAVWKNFAGPSDEGGDLLRLVAVFACGGDNSKSVKWSLDWMGLTGKTPDPKETKELLARVAKREHDAVKSEARKRAAARAMWLGAKPLDGTDPASLYLKARGIDVAALPAGRAPHALRFDPACLALPENTRLPALLANISGTEGHIATHRTYLAQYGGVWGKAFKGEERDGKPVPAKRVIGAFAGGSIRLTRGDSGQPLAKAPADEWPAIGEGIETVLTAALAMPTLRCLSAVSGSNLGNVALPPQIKGVHLIADNDDNEIAQKMFDRAADNYLARGIEPVIVRAPAGIKDLNDMVKGTAA